MNKGCVCSPVLQTEKNSVGTGEQEKIKFFSAAHPSCHFLYLSLHLCDIYIRRIRETIIPPSIIRWIYAKHLIVTFRCNVEIKVLCGWAAQKIDFTDMPRSRSLFKISLIQREEVILIPFFSLVYLALLSQ